MKKGRERERGSMDGRETDSEGSLKSNLQTSFL